MIDCGINYKGTTYTKEEFIQLMQDPVFAEELRINVLTDKFLDIFNEGQGAVEFSEILNNLKTAGLISDNPKQRRVDARKIYNNISNRNINNNNASSSSGIGIKAISWLNKKFGQGPLKAGNRQVYESFIYSQNTIKSELRSAQKNSDELNNLISRLGNSLLPEDKLGISDVLAGKDPNQVLKLSAIKDNNKRQEVRDKIVEITKKMRFHIDNLSNKLIDNGYLSESGVEIIQNNKGQYVTRIYEAHINPEGWFNKLTNSNDPEMNRILTRGKKFVKDGLIRRYTAMKNLIERDQNEFRQNVKGPEPANLYEILVEVGAIDSTEMSKKDFKKLPQEDRVAMYEANSKAKKMVKDRNDFLSLRIDDRKQAVSLISKILESDDSLVNYIQQTLITGKSVFDKQNNAIKTSTSIFKKRGEIPEEIRELMGEVKDPITSYVATVKKMVEFEAKYDFQLAFALQGEGVLFSRTKTDEFDTEFSIASMPGVKDVINVPDDKIYVSKDMANDLSPEMETVGHINTLISVINSLFKWNVTVGSINTQEKNFSTAFLFMLLNGNLLNKNFFNSFSIILSEAKNLAVEGVSGKLGRPIDVRSKFLEILDESAVRNGVLNNSIDIKELSELSNNIKNSKIAKIINSKFGFENSRLSSILKTPADIASTPIQLLNAMYAASDNLIKLTSYFNELDRYAPTVGDYKGYQDILDKANSGDEKAIQDLKKLEFAAAKAVRDTVPNYSESWRVNKWFRENVPFFGVFTTFLTESLRTQYNAVNYTFDSFKSMSKETDPKMRAAFARIARQRLLGIIGAYALTLQQESLREIISNALGIDDEEEEFATAEQRDVFMKYWTPEWINFVDLRKDRIEDGGFIYADPSTMNPYALLNNFNFQRNESETILGDFIFYLKPIISPFLSPELGTESIIRILDGFDENGNKISSYEKFTPEYFSDVFTYLSKSGGFLPTLVNEWRYNSKKEEEIRSLEAKLPNQSADQQYSSKLRIKELQESIVNHNKKYLHLGYKDNYVNIHKAAEYKMYELGDFVDSKKKAYRDKVKTDSDNFQEYYDKSNAEYKKQLDKYRKMFEETQRVLGVDISEDFIRTNKVARAIPKRALGYIIGVRDVAPDLEISDYEQRGGKYGEIEEEKKK